jgi:hypothetical protein
MRKIEEKKELNCSVEKSTKPRLGLGRKKEKEEEKNWARKERKKKEKKKKSQMGLTH